MVRILVRTPQNVAAESQRNIQQAVEVDLNDKIPDVKVKITLVYTQLQPDNFTLQYMGIPVMQNATILDLLKQYKTQNLSFTIRKKSSCCNLI